MILSFPVWSAPILQDLNYILPSPPKTEDPNSLYQWIYQIYQRWNVLQSTTQEPNVNIDADVGQNIIYFDGTNYWLAIETTSPHGTTWKGVKLGNV